MIPAVPGPLNHALNRLPSIAGWRQGQGVLYFWGDRASLQSRCGGKAELLCKRPMYWIPMC